MSRASAIAVRICDENVGRCALLFARLPEKAHRRAKRHENAAAVADTATPKTGVKNALRAFLAPPAAMPGMLLRKATVSALA